MVVAAVPIGVIVAIALLLIIWASFYIYQRPLVALLSRLPVVGGYVAGTVANAIGALVALVTGWARTGVGALADLIGAVVAQFGALVDGIVGALEALYRYAASIAVVAGGLVGSVATQLSQLAANIANLGTIVATVKSTATTALTRATHILTTDLPGAIAGVRSWAAAQLAAAVSALNHALTAAALATAQAIDAVRHDALGAIGQAIDGFRLEVGRLVGQAVDAVRAEVQTLGRAVDGIDLRLSGQLGDIVKSLAPILALNIPLVLPRLLEQVKTMDRECVTPTCGAIKPSINALNAINQGLVLAGLAVLLGKAIEDPEGAARDMAGTVDTLHDLAESVLSPLSGGRL